MAEARRTCAGIQVRATPVPRMCDREDRLRSALRTRRSRARDRAMADRCDPREGRAGGRARRRRRRNDDRSGQSRCTAIGDHARHDARRSVAGCNGSGCPRRRLCNEPSGRCAFAAAGPFASSTAGMVLARDGASSAGMALARDGASTAGMALARDGAGTGGQPRCRSMQPSADSGPQHASAHHGAFGSLHAATD